MRSCIFIFYFFLAAPTAQTQISDTSHTRLNDIFGIGTVQSLMIQKDDDLVFEVFRDGMDRTKTTNIKSASKSILSLLVGIAIAEGHIEGVNQKIGPFFPDYFNENPDSLKESITIEHLLTMRTGLETTSFHNYGRWVLSDNWTHFALSQSFEEEPGGRMVYSTGTSHLLSVILTRATGMSTRAYAQEKLFNPLGIRVGGWDQDPQGYYMGGNNVALSPFALLKIGELVLNMGEYEGQQVVPRSWIRNATQVYTRSNYNDYDYGYMWWQKEAANRTVIFAWGNGGQYSMILPDLDAVISITSDVNRRGNSRRYQQRIFSFLEDEIIPFLIES